LGCLLTKRDGEFKRRRSGAAGRLLLVPRAFVAAMAGSALVVGVVAWLVFVSVPQVDLSLETKTNGRWIVSGVPLGERAWLIGIRPGMEVESFAPADARDGNWTSLAVSDGVVHLTVQRFYPPPDAIWATMSLVALVGSIFAVGVAPSVAWWLLLAPTLIVLAVASDLVTAPVSLLVGLAPPAIGGLSLVDPGRRLGSRVLLISAGLIGVVAGCWLIGARPGTSSSSVEAKSRNARRVTACPSQPGSGPPERPTSFGSSRGRCRVRCPPPSE